MISQLSPSTQNPPQLYVRCLLFAMLAGAWLLPCHNYLVLVCTQLPGGGCSPDTERRNAHSQLGLDAVPELITFLGTQSMG